MPPRDPQAILQKLGQTTLKIDAFFLRQTGFIANQTLLKLGEYNLNCVPATIGLEEAKFLAVLTPSEVSLFSRFKEGTHILILTFDNPDAHDIARFPIRVGLLSLDPVADRKNVCFLTLKLKSLPAEFVLFLGDYLDNLEERLATWEGLSDTLIPYAINIVLSAGLGYGAVLGFEDQRISIEIIEFHTKKIVFRAAEAELPAPGPHFSLRLIFQGRPLNLEGSLEQPGVFAPEFSPEWLSFVEESLFHQGLKARPKRDPSS